MINIYVPQSSPHTALCTFNIQPFKDLRREIQPKMTDFKSKNARKHLCECDVCECVTIYRVLCWVWCKECDCRWYLSPYSRSSWSQSPLTVPASPASCQSNIWREDLQNTLTHTIVTSLYSAAQRKLANYICLVVRGMSGNIRTMQACVRHDQDFRTKQEEKLYKFIFYISWLGSVVLIKECFKT